MSLTSSQTSLVKDSIAVVLKWKLDSVIEPSSALIHSHQTKQYIKYLFAEHLGPNVSCTYGIPFVLLTLDLNTWQLIWQMHWASSLYFYYWQFESVYLWLHIFLPVSFLPWPSIMKIQQQHKIQHIWMSQWCEGHSKFGRVWVLHTAEVICLEFQNLNREINTCDDLNDSVPDVIFYLCVLNEFDNDINVPD